MEKSMTIPDAVRARLNELHVIGGDPARAYALLLEAFRSILDTAEAERRELTVREKSGLNQTIPWLVHGKLEAAQSALDGVFAQPCDTAPGLVDERSSLDELTIDDFRRALQHLTAMEPWM